MYTSEITNKLLVLKSVWCGGQGEKTSYKLGHPEPVLSNSTYWRVWRDFLFLRSKPVYNKCNEIRRNICQIQVLLKPGSFNNSVGLYCKLCTTYLCR